MTTYAFILHTCAEEPDFMAFFPAVAQKWPSYVSDIFALALKDLQKSPLPPQSGSNDAAKPLEVPPCCPSQALTFRMLCSIVWLAMEACSMVVYCGV